MFASSSSSSLMTRVRSLRLPPARPSFLPPSAWSACVVNSLFTSASCVCDGYSELNTLRLWARSVLIIDRSCLLRHRQLKLMHHRHSATAQVPMGMPNHLLRALAGLHHYRRQFIQSAVTPNIIYSKRVMGH